MRVQGSAWILAGCGRRWERQLHISLVVVQPSTRSTHSHALRQARPAHPALSEHLPLPFFALTVLPPSLTSAMDDLFGSDSNTPDATSDFLKREQEALGESFGTAPISGEDKDYEAGASAFPDLDDGLDDFTSAPQSAAPSVPQSVSVTGNNEFAAFESEYPDIEVPEEEVRRFRPIFPFLHPAHLVVLQPQPTNGFAPSPSPIGLAAPAFSAQPPSFVGTPAPQQEGESEFIKCVSPFPPPPLYKPSRLSCVLTLPFRRSWRTKQAQEIEAREEAAKAKKEDAIAKARNAIDNFYKEYNERKEKDIAKNKCVPLSFLSPSFLLDLRNWCTRLKRSTSWSVDVKDSGRAPAVLAANVKESFLTTLHLFTLQSPLSQGGRRSLQVDPLRLSRQGHNLGAHLHPRRPARLALKDDDQEQAGPVEVQGDLVEPQEGGGERARCGWVLMGGVKEGRFPSYPVKRRAFFPWSSPSFAFFSTLLLRFVTAVGLNSLSFS